MNKSARILFLVVALVAAAFVSYVVYQKTAKQSTALTPESKQEIVQIVVMANNLNRGAKITAQDLHMAPYLKNTVPSGHFTDLTTAVDRVVLKPLQATEPLLESALAPTDIKKGGMAAVINPQKRAMAVKVNEVIGVAGFLHPGHMVDVLVSLTQPGEQKGQITKTILENILVLSVGTEDQETVDNKTKTVTVVTLEVNLEEAEKLSLAVDQGTIQLALRGYSDSDQILTKGTTVPTLLKSYATASNEPVKVEPVKVSEEKTAIPAAKPRIARRPLVIEVINGDNKVNRTIEGN